MFVRCEACGREAKISEANRGKRLRCSHCGGVGKTIRWLSPEPVVETPSVIARDKCIRCGTIIPEIRLQSKPETRLCIDCEHSHPPTQTKRVVVEPLGSREAYKRDRASWKRSH